VRKTVAKLCRVASFELGEAERQGKLDKNEENRLRAVWTRSEAARSLAQIFLPLIAKFVVRFDTITDCLGTNRTCEPFSDGMNSELWRETRYSTKEPSKIAWCTLTRAMCAQSSFLSSSRNIDRGSTFLGQMNCAFRTRRI
jgi:hypothetical protein